ncbi:MAG: type II secretion system F family protein [Candidatus Pacebacteria bacterium]|nr:type II secretion system F family protein [Candidatus Paceibacterota bacterium]MBP9700927.1 type II secretion system F family protein [Candidatus Paceibacterota bacterium]
MKFIYKGRDTSGTIVSGSIVANDKAEAIVSIRDTGIVPMTVDQKDGFSFTGSITLFKRVKLSEKIIFTKNISGMLRAGLPLSRSLEVLTKQTTNVYFKSVIATLLDTIDKGGTFSDGLAKFPKVFSSLFVAMVRAGEESGGMPNALSEIGLNLEKSYALNRKVKSALMYPLIIISAIVLIAILMFIYVVPTLIKTFKELGTELPTSTKIVVGISDLISNHLGLLAIGLAVFVGGIYMAFRLPQTRRMIDYVSVHAPVLGVLVQEINAARTARTFSSLLTSGVSISRAIVITQEVVQNSYYKSILAEVQAAVEKGEPMSGVFKRYTKFYPVMVGEMMEVGEETGKLSGMLLDIANFYEGEVDAKTKDLSTIIEPVLMIFIGAGVGFFAVSMLSPMYSIMDSIQ